MPKLNIPPCLPTVDLFQAELAEAQKNKRHADCNLCVEYANEITAAANKLSADFFEIKNAAYKAAQKFLSAARENRYAVKAVQNEQF